MSTYEKLHGRAIQAVTTDPSESSSEGQVWYNTTTDVFKSVLQTEAWVSTTPMTTPRPTMAGGGTNTSAIITGKNGANPSDAQKTESYNGSGWTTQTNVPAPRGYANGTGSDSEEYVQAGGGYPSKTTDVYDWDGSSWTSGTAIPTATIEAGMCGPAADALYCGGNNGLTTTYERSGGSWTSGGTMAAGVYAPTLVGVQTAAISMGGVKYPGGYQDDNQEYNGSSWTALTNLPAVRGYAGGAGIQTLAMIIGGEAPPTYSSCLEWNGTSWNTLTSLGTARNTMAPMGKTTNTAVAPPGNSSPAGTEEFNRSINIISDTAWASGTAVNTGRYNGYSTASSPPSALLFFGGITGVPGNSTNTAKTEEFNGSTWSEQTDMPTATTTGGTGGLQTAAISMGGYQGGSLITSCYSYNGSSWGSIPSLPTATGNTKGCGTSTAGLFAGGKNPGAPSGTTATFEYDGEGWASGGAMSTPRWQCAVYGTQTAAVASGGQGFISTTEEYGGTSWTSGGALITASGYLGSNGAQTGGLVYGGETTPAKLSQCVGYDGTAYSTRPSMATARGAVANGGGDTSATAVAISGDTPQTPSAMTTSVEEYSEGASTVNVKTLTQG